jgi:hypothetical protein
MRAFAVQSFGQAPAIHDLPIPDADSAFLLRVRYAGVNPIDYKLLERLTATSIYPNAAPRTLSSGVPGHTARTPSTLRSHRMRRQNRWPASPTGSLTNRHPRCPSRQ